MRRIITILKKDMRPMGLMRLIGLTVLMSLMGLSVHAQIKIGGNVYGGGNHAEVKGSTKVTVKAGDIGAVMDPDETKRPLADPSGKVFGGARMANVGGSSFVHIDGENATDYILINQVFGGNDIAGTIGTAAAVGEEIPTELTAVKKTTEDATNNKKNAVDNTFNSYVRISTKTLNPNDQSSYYTQDEITAASTNPEAAAYGKKTTDIKPDPTAKKIYIGQLFGGGNGDFTYTDDEGNQLKDGDDYIIKQGDAIIARSATPFQLPEQNKTYLEIKGGSIVYGYGGGNNATVKEQNIIHIDNPSAVVNHILVDATGVEANDATYATNTANGTNTLPDGYTDLLTEVRFKEMGINTTFSKPSSGEYQIGRFFGGNNKAEMSIRPTWNLLAGKVRNLYSGGNRGSMTSPEGLLLEIKDYSSLIVDNLYGGCRMADVKPTKNGEYVPCTNLDGYNFPNELSARVLVAGGHINNVYGGNDVTGTVYGGNAVGIHTTVYGDVYGGGNGAYPYTDLITEDNETDGEIYGDFHYNVTSSSTDALKAFRPNAEQVSLHLWGESAKNPTVIHGSVFVGGNCASLNVKKSQPLVELKIGSHIIVDNVYLGNNGEGMIDQSYLEKYADDNFSSLNLTNSQTFSSYMDAVAMTLMPKIVFDSQADGDRNNYIDYSSYIGSFFCGGNVGSMAIPGKMTFNVNRGLNIYNKFVGGCNNADIPAKAGLNAAYNGGIIGSEEERGNTSSTFYTDNGLETGNIKDRLEINFQNMTVVPMRWNNTFAPIAEADTKLSTTETGKRTLIAGREYYTSNLQDTKFIADGTEEVDLTAANKYYKMTVVGNDFEWNTGKYSTVEDEFVSVAKNTVDTDIRLLNGNIYGGCYNSGHVNGNVILNINDDVVKKDEIFGTGNSTFYNLDKSGVDFEGQRDDVMASALYVYGAGHGKDTEIWGSTTINHNQGYAFQLYGGGEQGAVGKRQLNTDKTPVLDKNGNYVYKFDPKYSTTVNLNGVPTIFSHDGTVENLAEAEYLYGGGNEGIIAGNTLVNLGNGRIYDAFGGSSDADILGHTEVFVGRQPNGNGGYKDGFPWLRDNVYGGNDFGGTIYGEYEDDYDFKKRLKNYETDKTQIHGYKAGEIPEVLKSSSYVEYLQGRVDSIFGGSYGSYNYANTELYGTGCSMPKQESAFVNIRPKNHAQNYILHAYGAGTGHPGIREDDGAQQRSYVLVDIADEMTNFGNTEVFGAGSFNGIGMNFTPEQTFAENFNLDKASAIIDLLRGRIHNAYGGSYQEGITRRTVVNVPKESSIQIDSIFGGAYGKEILPPCDVYETQVNYKNTSEKAQVFGAIFGGNNNERRSLFTQVNISSPVYSNKEKGYTGTVYGAGRGIDTWSEHTEVNLLAGAKVYNVYGGGEMGHVLNSASVQAYMNLFKENLSPQISQQDPFWKSTEGGVKYNIVDGNRVPATEALKVHWRKDWANAWRIGDYYNPIVEGKDNDGNASSYDYTKYATNTHTSLAHFANRPELDDKTAAQLDGAKKHNTNVIVNKGAVVEGYAYGGGLGDASVAQTGDIYGSTYIVVLGGEVKKDVYAGGRAGGVDNLFGATDFAVSSNKFVATANAYVQGGTARNVYGGGYEGHVGHHDGDIHTTTESDRPAEAYVVIGKKGTDTFDGGAPAITRNVYGGGEGGSVYGSSEVTINNGYIGYRYKANGANGTGGAYVEELDDQKPGDLELSGNVFGGGYVANSYVDSTTVNMYGGTIRGSLYGGGEIGPIGRGTIRYKETYTTGLVNQNARIFRAGTTNVNMFDGLVKRNVFGGGRGKDSWGGDGTMYMDKTVVAALDLKCKGFVFGQTHVNIHGGEIGTGDGMAYGYGNVFGGGDEGSVYSAYTDSKGVLQVGQKSGKRYDKSKEGYYYINNKLTEDCKVVVEPYCLASSAMDIGGKTYAAGTYVPTTALNHLKNKTDDASYWNELDSRGIIIHNAVFAGGNISAGSSTQNANDKTVFGNATASIHDAYNRDLITIGTGHTGGLYGDGNLTFVDGYRELNITNYGTDYYNIDKQLTYDEYKVLPAREQAYYELKYKCLVACTDIDGTTYSIGSNVPMDELLAQFTESDGKSKLVGTDSVLVTVSGKKVPNPAIWQENGVVSVYAGRIMNTIQRADFCGVFGSRMVMKGAQDRVPEEADYTNYTINRVREVSLNKKHTTANDPETIVVDNNAIPNPNYEHGNYFGIYSVVNYLGALTSDVTFDQVRVTENKDAAKYKTPVTIDNQSYDYGTASYYQWKQANIGKRNRNNGSCHNQLALASGVYLELTSEEKTGGTTVDTKEWGPITGIVELDLINVQPGMGGGFVYAKNIHGVRSTATNPLPPLTTLNMGAASQKNYKYDTTDAAYANGTGQYQWETSGNFIHSTQTIIDDCYNISNRYYGADKVLAHYWYISGSVYVYDQYISAYTGSPNAYSETVEIPISISAASNGTLTLLDVQPNFYAYYKSYTNETTNTPLSGDQKLVINDVTYQQNDPITYWEWKKLSASQQKLFVRDTYVLKDSCFLNSQYYPAGYVMLPAEYNSLKTHAVNHEIDGETVLAVKKATKDADGKPVVLKDYNNNDVYVAFYDAFRSSNNLSHGTGYQLTYNMTNPGAWNKWYTQLNGDNKITLADYSNLSASNQANYTDGPTYSLKIATGGKLLGQQDYDVNAIIPEKTVTDYNTLKTSHPSDIPGDQAVFNAAYLVTKEYTSSTLHYYPGAPVSEPISGYTSPAFVSTATIQLSSTEYIYVNDLMTEAQKTTYYNRFKEGGPEANAQIAKDIDDLIKPAYICTTAGKYGGSYYVAGRNYRALEAYSAMSPEDRENFKFNYDALDLLIDPNYSKNPATGAVIHPEGKKYQYDSAEATLEGAEANAAAYSLANPLDYTATYNGTNDTTPHNGITLTKNQEYSRAEYEKLPNEQRHYAPIAVTDASANYYIVKEAFIHGDEAYAVGTTISSTTYSNLSENEQNAYIATLTGFPAGNATYYYCREEYKIGEKEDEGVEPTPVTGITGADSNAGIEGSTVKVGTIINATSTESSVGYASLPNYQTNFTIHGVSPLETSTLYVARYADINDLSTEKIITVIYQYDYEESDETGNHITPVTERHVVNIHINFKSGVPTVEDINPPTVVLPGTGITMRVPSVTPGAYEITGGGWELFDNPDDAESHINGMPYTPSVDPLYWYQDGFYLAYYAKTYLGKTYSNHVPVSVANYHDLKRVMDDKTTHLHVDYDRNRLKRDSKIYINDYSASSENGLDLFKDFYDLSLLTSGSTGVANDVVTADGRLKGHHILNQVNGPKAGENLQFILRTDIARKDNPATSDEWTSIASGENPCFNGTFHGDGHTISGLDNSLFGKLCGNVYNLGVTGSFTGAGIAETGDGYVENCWISTSSTATKTNKPVFGTPTNSSSFKQIVNSYYMEEDDATKKYENHTGSYGIPTRKSAKAFYNGEVAYDLNGFYLYKRYNDGVHTTEGVGYKYFTLDANGNILNPETPLTGHYADNMDKALSSSGYGNIKYVEDRFADGDFVFAAGEIPTTEDERHWTDTEHDNQSCYAPIWPDDYIYFGQKLTYGWAAEAHQDVPTAVVREGGRLSTSANANRVYRAPAYYRSKDMGVAHFNPHAYLAQKEKLTTAQIEAHATPREAYPRMTAIDFKGHYEAKEAYGSYGLGLNTQTGQFYAPLLDDDGLLSIQNCDETQNLVVYAPAADVNAKTLGVLNGYFIEPIFDEHYDNSLKYRLVSEASTASIHGHLVQNDKKASYDHLLVDRQDFNAPIAYSFDNNHLMWYQRIPTDKEYVDLTKGWQDISVPFTAELVTTNQKGEITHFYSGSDESHNDTGTKKGHEYWLREFRNIEEDKTNPNNIIAKGTFGYPNAAGESKTVENSFLWDYYYQNEFVHDQQDANSDIYLQYRQYYKDPRPYANYPLLQAGTPYILGLPGETYYEFDLSGKFLAQNTKVSIPQLGKQIITFASVKGAAIGVSDDEMTGKVVKYGNNDYTFKPSYMNEALEASSNSYTLNAAGDSYNKVTAATNVSAFRPYFTVAASASPAPQMPQQIVFDTNSSLNDGPESVLNGNLELYVKDHKIVATSYLKEATTVRIINVSGVTIANFVIKPGETVETPVSIEGVYIANKKKLLVK
jgi:hypothetical protein